MKAVYAVKQDKIENEPLKYGDLDLPAIEEGQVLVKVQANGVCHSDLHIIEGDFPLPKELFPLVPGHEIVGEVVESKNRNVKEGERVGIGWFYSACGQCEYCTSGRENLCPNATVTGINRWGGYAEYAILDGNYVSKIPEGLDSAEAAPLFCAGITAYSSVRKIGPKVGDRIAVFGVGGLGFYAIQMIEAAGARAIAVTSSHNKVAEMAGASEVIEEPKEGYDAAIVFAPNSSIVAKAVKSVKPGGTVVVPAIMDKIEVPFQYFTWEKNITSVASGFRSETRSVLKLAADGRLKSMIKTMPLSEAKTALMDLKRGKVQGRIVLKP
ncbi:alcohol dehydrogenase catalytic domain-containing protein [Thermoplasma sp.]|uniref:alcohol dehydrogenase catalytic domain-containing protein n=1 Tax=Thermoplasma sp. TaxID=1973142 RepID=UPI0026100068|nr:alcohol dehydrogenase catalytic domain-containing protein [Thermoplasma sp.]